MSAETTFRALAPSIMSRLRGDFPFSNDDAAAVVGNAGHESLGFTALQEISPTVKGSRGGWGWFQWTGPRRVAFEAYCKRNNLSPSSDKANYAWLFIELTSSEKGAVAKTRAAALLPDKVDAFEESFLRAGVKASDDRLQWAKVAADAYAKVGAAVQATPAPDKIAALRDEGDASVARSSQAAGGAASVTVSGAGGGGLAIANHAADWLLIAGVGGLVAVAIGLLIWKAIEHNRRGEDLHAAADALQAGTASVAGAV